MIVKRCDEGEEMLLLLLLRQIAFLGLVYEQSGRHSGTWKEEEGSAQRRLTSCFCFLFHRTLFCRPLFGSREGKVFDSAGVFTYVCFQSIFASVFPVPSCHSILCHSIYFRGITLFPEYCARR